MKSISVILPAYNEEKFLKKIINKIKKVNFKKQNYKYDIMLLMWINR